MAKYKVVITDWGGPDIDIEEAELKASGLDAELVRLQANAQTPADQLIPQVKDADALIVQWAKVDQQVIDSLEKCKVISRYGIGVDMVDLKAAGARGIPVANVNDYCFDEVSTHTLTFLLMLNRHILQHHEFVKGGNWGKSPLVVAPNNRLELQTVGIVGMGNIGREVAAKAKPFVAKIIAFDPFLSAEKAAEIGVELVSFDELLRRADYITVHVPLMDETRHMFNAEAFAKMKPSAFLINMARGPVVDQVALFDALKSGKIAGAGLDVLEKEPPNADDPILTCDNVLFSPHSSSGSVEAGVALRKGVIRNVVDALEGRSPKSVVNKKDLNAVKS